MRAPVRRRSDELWCVVLAAGGSRRLGRPKQLLRYRGRPLLLRAVAAADFAARGRTVVVLGARSAPLSALLRRSPYAVHVVRNGRWRSGLAGSLRTGLAALPRTARAALITLCDQPRVDALALARLVRAWRQHRAHTAAAEYAGRVGVPAILPRKLWCRAAGLRGDVGARVLLAQLRDISRVPMPEAEIDIDTPEDARGL